MFRININMKSITSEYAWQFPHRIYGTFDLTWNWTRKLCGRKFYYISSVRKIMNCNKSFIHILRFATPCSSYKITVWIIINAHGGVIMYAYSRKHFVCRFDVCVLAFAWISNELMQCAKTSFRLRDLPREH